MLDHWRRSTRCFIFAAIAHGPWSFALFRFIGGLGIGASTIAAPGYLSEIAPAKSRGWLVALFDGDFSAVGAACALIYALGMIVAFSIPKAADEAS